MQQKIKTSIQWKNCTMWKTKSTRNFYTATDL